MASITEALKAALDLHGAGRLDEAAALYARILTADPEHARTLYFAGTLLCQQGRFADARNLLVRAVAREPDLMAAHANLAKIDAGAGDWAGALAASRRLLALDPADAPGWDILGTAERRSGRTDAAIIALKRAHRVVPGADGGKLGLLLFERGRSHLDARRSAAALADLTAAATLMSFDPDLGFARATALVELGRDAEAVTLCERLMAWTPAEPPLLHNLGVALMRTGRTADRLRVLRRASALAPDNPEPCHALAAAFEGRDAEEARRWSTRALSLKLRATPPASPPASPPDPPAGRTLDVVSFSLWGRLELYCGGALENARRIPAELPGWRCRFHHDDSVPAHILTELAALGAELVEMPSASTSRQGLFWRFLVADDPAVRRFLCRDCDSRTTAREIAAVREWLDSGLPFHAMRDHVMHMEPVMGGMWGGTAGHLPPIRPAIDRFTASRSSRWDDQHFLAEWLWPRIAGRVLVHDDLHGGLGRRFPEPVAAGDSHVGAKLFPLVRLPETRVAVEAEPWTDAPGRHGRLAFPATVPHIGRSLDTLGEWLGIEAALCARFLKADGAALDASAGIGAHALAFAEAVGPRGRVLAVEPSPGLSACLARSLALNGEVPITPCRTLAEAIPHLPMGGRVDLVRATLAHAEVTLDPLILELAARHRPAFYFRVAEDGAQRDAVARLMPLGYRLWWHVAPVFNPANRRKRTGNPFPGLVTINALALPDDHGDPPSHLTRIDAPDSSWQEAAWRLTCDGF